MHHVKQVVIGCVVVMGVSLGLLVTGVQAASGNLEPPTSAVDGSGDPTATTQTQPSWDQNLPVAERFVTVLDTSVANVRQAILDRNTGLVWERYPGDLRAPLFVIDENDRVPWNTAKNHCARSEVANVMGWRLPSLQELQSLLDLTNPGGNPDFLPVGHPFLSVQSSSFFWSVSTNVSLHTSAWIVSMRGGLDNANKTSDSFLVWCVRGQGGLSEY